MILVAMIINMYNVFVIIYVFMTHNSDTVSNERILYWYTYKYVLCTYKYVNVIQDELIYSP